MRRVLLPMLILLLVMPMRLTAAPPLNDLTALARFAPPDNVIFAALRTDPAYFEELDSLLGFVASGLPGLLPPGITARALVNDQLIPDFDEQVAPWLGDTVAISLGFSTSAATPDTLFIMNITDRAAALAYLNDRFGLDTRFEAQDIASYTLYQDSRSFDPLHLLLGEDVLIYSNNLSQLETVARGDFSPLSASAAFTDALTYLPAAGYNAVAYMATSQLLLATQSLGSELDNPAVDLLATADITQIFGLTILEGRTLALDFASNIGNLESMAAIMGDMPLPDPADYPPVDLNFLRHLPASTQFVVLGTGLGPQLNASFNSLSMLGELAQQQMASDFGRPGLAMQPFTAGDLGGLFQGGLTVTFAGLTGLHLEEDVLRWLPNDYAVYASLIAVASDLPASLDLGLLAAVSDADAAANIVARITDAAERYDAPRSTERIGSGQALVLPQLVRVLLEQALPRSLLDATPELDLLIGADESVLAIGLRPGVTYALDPVGVSLADTPGFGYAAGALLLPEAQTVAYINPAALRAALNDTNLVAFAPELAQLSQLLGLLESATISTRMPSAAFSQGRFTMTFAAR